MIETLAILGGIALFPAMAAGLSLGFHLFTPHWSRKKRIGRAALLATLVPMMLPLVAILFEAASGGLGDAEDLVLSLLAILSLTAIAGAVLALPSAWYVSERLTRRDGEAPPPAIEHDEDVPALTGTGA
ncbi:hypothetical protein [Alteraurantiacibacter aquimixticola]|uniref:Uncharacterized protein n=1 Tax=Alteraurantiacibacter aquimixticola TaxID=2489173 RepID=A0A4T3F054_9SPHN|nr:hypothetical protein [Alteraurantiacibacter aquimixticola]TIX50294.1 hypothetical protein E5222_08390 [Alteraurantiacibacter aquimixticola]